MGIPLELLTPDEHAAIRMAGELSTFITERIITHGDPREREWDIRQLEAAIHVVQCMVGWHAAARAYPGKYRMLGSILRKMPPADAAGSQEL